MCLAAKMILTIPNTTLIPQSIPSNDLGATEPASKSANPKNLPSVSVDPVSSPAIYAPVCCINS